MERVKTRNSANGPMLNPSRMLDSRIHTQEREWQSITAVRTLWTEKCFIQDSLLDLLVQHADQLQQAGHTPETSPALASIHNILHATEFPQHSELPTAYSYTLTNAPRKVPCPLHAFSQSSTY